MNIQLEGLKMIGLLKGFLSSMLYDKKQDFGEVQSAGLMVLATTLEANLASVSYFATIGFMSKAHILKTSGCATSFSHIRHLTHPIFKCLAARSFATSLAPNVRTPSFHTKNKPLRRRSRA